jgi:hypothetical protein
MEAMKEFDLEDPFTLVGVGLAEDPDDEALTEMAWAVVEEYVRLGWTGDQIVRLFHNRFFQLAHQVLRVKGEAFVRELGEAVDRMRAEAQEQLRGVG